MFQLKKHLPLLLIAFMLLNTQQIFAQSGRLARANAAYDKLAYSPAIELYKSVLDDSDNFEAMSKLADCYRLTNQYPEAEYWYGKVCNKTEAEPEDMLYYAEVLQTNEKYVEAAKWYQKYIEQVPGDKRADNQLKASQNYRQFFKDVDRYRIEHLNFNSGVYDFITGNSTVEGIAESLAKYNTLFKNANLINTELEKYMKVTREDIKRVAEQYLVKENRVLLQYLPKTEEQ